MAKGIRERAIKKQEQKDTRPMATAKYVRMGSSKAKRILDTIRGKKYEEAMALIQFSPSTASLEIEKVLKSAGANAENNKGLSKDDLFVAECYANPGPTIKRHRMRGKGGVNIILKRTCHITIVLDSVK